jgi:hypothetical protein
MWKGSGERSVTDFIQFESQFLKTPKLHVALHSIDASKDANLRIVIDVDAITPSGFECTIQTWGNTKLAFVDIAWIAIGK